ncbi:MAG TPA: S8 family serine peptidase [Polyangiaceae bacterium]|nr:S8 family serine peptidase [Polyangiaceae bacterium]
MTWRSLRSLLQKGLAGALCVAALSATTRASAQLELGSAWRSLARSGATRVPQGLLQNPAHRLPLLVEYPADSGVSELLVGGRYRPLWLAPEELPSFVQDHPQLLLHWAPPRFVQMDQAAKWISATTFRQQTGFTGKGVVIGIVDTGLDVAHRDLRDAQGKSRVRYMLDFSRPAAGRQPDLEEEYGCTDSDCAIFSNTDLDDILNNGVTGDEPRDTFGHGTHVASLAAGNGLASPDPRYIGVAPEAMLFGARVSRAGDGAIQDPDIILATRFIFEQAERLGVAAVVNLSLGSDFGAHDGSSALEQGLASFVGPEFPGRAIVVAAGNSGNLFEGIGTGEPEPYGIHTEVHIPRESPVEVPLMTPTEALGARRGATIYVWIGFREGDDVSLALDRNGDPWIPDIAPGEATTFNATGYQATIFNGPGDSKNSIKVGPHNAVLVVEGDFDPGSVFTMRLSGHGTASIWVQATGGASPDTGVGALVPRGEKQGTINIPASHPGLIAVGATVNRNRWRDYKHMAFLVGRADGSAELAEVDGTATFSAAGPTATGVMKPDIVAPGMYVVGAMSGDADPRKNGGLGVFASQGRCGNPDYECFVTDDDEHAVTSGTSMSAPMVSGAIALIFEAHPELTQGQLRALLQAGARQPSGPILEEQQVGPGELDLLGTLAALDAEDSPLEREPGSASRIALAASFIHPDPQLGLQGLLELRDDRDRVADGFDERRLLLEVTGGSLSAKPVRVAPGLYTFTAAAPEGSGGKELVLELSFDGKPLAQRRVPIGTDRWAAEGTAYAHGGCAASPRPSPSVGWLVVVACSALLGSRRRRARCAS